MLFETEEKKSMLELIDSWGLARWYTFVNDVIKQCVNHSKITENNSKITAKSQTTILLKIKVTNPQCFL